MSGPSNTLLLVGIASYSIQTWRTVEEPSKEQSVETSRYIARFTEWSKQGFILVARMMKT
jgi:hypothetical protein